MKFKLWNNRVIEISKYDYASFVGFITALTIICTIQIISEDQSNIEIVQPNWERTSTLPENLRWWIDYIDENDDSVIMGGYAFIHNEALSTVDMSIILFDGTNYYKIETDINNLGDLSLYFNEGFDYDNGRFVACVKKTKLDYGKTYNIYLLYRNNEHDFLIDLSERIQLDGDK